MEESGGVPLREGIDQRCQSFVVKAADHLGDGLLVDAVASKGDGLIQQADGVAHTTGGIFRDHGERVVGGVNAFLVADVAQVGRQHRCWNAMEIETLGARKHRLWHFLWIGGRQNKKHMLRWFFQRF